MAEQEQWLMQRNDPLRRNGVLTADRLRCSLLRPSGPPSEDGWSNLTKPDAAVLR